MGKRKNTSTADSKPKESGHASSSESLKNADENNEMKEEQEDPVMDSADSQAETSDSLPANDGPESAFAGLKKKKKKLVESSSLNDERVDAGEDLDEHVNDEEEVERRVLQQQRYPWEGSDTDHIYDEASSPDVYEDREAREVCKKLVSTRNEVDVSGLKSAWSMKRTSWRDHRFNIMPPQYRQGKLGNCLSVAVWRMWYAHVKLHQLDRGKLTEIQLRNERRGSESFEPICEYMKKNGFVDDMFIHKRPSSGSVEENEKFDTLLKRLYKQGPVAVEFIPCQSYLGANGMGIICPTSYERCRQHYEFFTTHIALLTGHGIHFGCDNPMKFWEIYESRGETFGDGGFITLAQGMGLIQTAVEMKFYDTGYNFEEEGLYSDDSHDQDESKDDDGSKSRGRIHESIEDGINACQDLENFLHNILPESGSQDHFIRIDEGTVTDDENDFGDGLKAGRYSVCLMEGSFDHLSESELRVKLEENLDKEYSILLIHYPEELKGAVYVIIEKPANSVLHQLPWNLVGSMATTIIECKPKNSVFGPLLEQALNDEDEETAKSEASNKRKRKKKNGGSTGTPQPAKTAKKSPVNANESPKSGGQSSGGSNKKQFNSGKQFGSNSKGKGKGKGRA